MSTRNVLFSASKRIDESFFTESSYKVALENRRKIISCLSVYTDITRMEECPTMKNIWAVTELTQNHVTSVISFSVYVICLLNE